MILLTEEGLKDNEKPAAEMPENKMFEVNNYVIP